MTIQEGNERIMRLAERVLRAEQPLCTIEEITDFSVECGLSEEESYAHLIAAAAGIEQNSSADEREFFERWLKPSLHKSDIRPYSKDPFFLSIPFHGQKRDNWCYGKETIQPGELFVEGDMILTPTGRVLPQLGFFSEAYAFPAVFENEKEWMSLAPNENATMKQPIAQAYGRVLTYGLGIGYYAFMTARKDNVKSVTVVERNPDAIRLFNENVLPYFEHPEKIHIVHEDAIRFAAGLKQNTYEYVFADIWRDAGDGIDLYCALKQYEKNAPGTHFSYWIEKSMDLYLNKSLWP